MKLTKLQLKQIVKEELKTLSEGWGVDWGGGHGAEHLEDWSPDQVDPERVQQLRQRWQDPKWSAQDAQERLKRYGSVVYKVEKERDEAIAREISDGDVQRDEAEKTFALTSDNIGLWGADMWNEYVDAKQNEWVAQQELAGYEAHLDAEKARDEAAEEEQRKIQGINEEKTQLTKQQLKEIIKEEINIILQEVQLGAPEEVSGLNVEYLGFDTEHDLTTWHFRVTMGDSTQNVEVGPTTMSDTDDLAELIGDALGYDWDALNAAIEQQLKDYPELVQDQKTAAGERARYQGY